MNVWALVRDAVVLAVVWIVSDARGLAKKK